MYVNRIVFKPEPQMEYKDKLYRIPVWIMRILVVLSFVFYDYYSTDYAITTALTSNGSAFGISLPVVYVLTKLGMGAVSLLLVEVVGSIYYNFVRPICPPVMLNKKGFMVYLRAAYVLRNIVGGLVKILYFSSDLYYFAFDTLIGVVVTTLVLALAYVYVNKRYVPNEAKSAFLKIIATPYLIYQFVSVISGVLL